MDLPKRIWINIARFFEALDGIDDPMGEYMFSFGKRVDKLEQDVDMLQKQMHSRTGRTVPNHPDG
jgi:hypothetical protein